MHALNTRRMGFPRAADQSETVPMRVRNTLQTVLESIEGEPSFQWMKIEKKRKRRKGREEREREGGMRGIEGGIRVFLSLSALQYAPLCSRFTIIRRALIRYLLFKGNS